MGRVYSLPGHHPPQRNLGDYHGGACSQASSQMHIDSLRGVTRHCATSGTVMAAHVCQVSFLGQAS